ncbi:UvrD-helicase domain-containing protein [Sporosarcina sp. P34]|uniref:UvrD-helicase domain-containing protein n=1 Tax=Sporosarcina sp. P34 TaxID=2048247 RepID=UPI00130466C0|nr:UvrD-helicase domain-containing protein [Sporosarcina sp. P34]
MCIDAEEREKILESGDPNILVDASAGTGKTTIMVDKALKYIKCSEFKHYQKVAMITFTRFATQQIRDKIIEYKSTKNIEENRLEVSTNNGFVLAEIIRPFLREAYGKEFPKGEEFRQEFSSEYKFSCWKLGIEQLQDKRVMGSYIQMKKDFTFQLALNVLKRSKNARKYIKVKYPAMFLDEYQDSGPEMHEFFMYLKDELNISLFIVGDIKQAIFGFRGADPELFKSLSNEGFTSYNLIHNFRSNLAIIKYTSYFLGESISQIDIESGVSINKHIDWPKFISQELQNIASDATVVYLVNSPRNFHRTIEKLESDYGFTYMEDPPLSTEYPNHDVLLPLLLLYHDGNNYNSFDLFNEIGVQTLQRHQGIIDNITQLLESEEVADALDCYSNLVERQFSISEKDRFQDCMEEKWKVQFCKEKPHKQIMTIHKSKGLDFDFVFVDAKSFYFSNVFQEQNHYVAITRPKDKIFINLNHNKYEDCLRGIVG